MYNNARWIVHQTINLVVITIAVSISSLFFVNGCSNSDTKQNVTSINIEPESVDPYAITIEYNGKEFEPRRLEIDVGKQVKFANQSKKDFWPASNIHPTHQILPEFDAKTPIGPGSAWSFTFNEAGFWRYHNHLRPEDAGLIVVYGQSKTRPEPLVIDISSIEFKDPKVLSIKEYINLYRNDRFLEEFIKEYGPAHAVQMVSVGAEHVDVLCHQRAHDIGRKAYVLFGAIAFAISGHECEAGAYHGATEALFRERGTANLVEDVDIICGEESVYFFQQSF